VSPVKGSQVPFKNMQLGLMEKSVLLWQCITIPEEVVQKRPLIFRLLTFHLVDKMRSVKSVLVPTTTSPFDVNFYYEDTENHMSLLSRDSVVQSWYVSMNQEKSHSDFPTWIVEQEMILQSSIIESTTNIVTSWVNSLISYLRLLNRSLESELLKENFWNTSFL
jgi:hypothetical protein